MQVMVIERFRDGAARAVYQRAQQQGRMLPDGVHFVDSWVAATLDRCWQLMECERIEQLHDWAAGWRDLVDFEFVPVVSSAEARERVLAP